MRPRLAVLILVSISTLAGLSPAATSATSPTASEDELLRTATLVFERAVDTPSAAIPAVVLMRALGMAVIPGAVRDGDRYYGKGVMSARGARPDSWTPPAVIAFEGEVPLDLDADTVDFIVIAPSHRGLDYLIDERFASSAQRTMAAGGIGHSAPVRINADLLAYMQFGTYFAGVTIDDWALRAMPASNATLYGRPYTTYEIVRGAVFFHVPFSARMWRDALADYFREMS